jgi:hypothetical protein
MRQRTSACVSIHQHASAYISMRQHTSACVSIHQHASAYISMRQHTSAYVSIRQQAELGVLWLRPRVPGMLHLLRQYLYFCTSKTSKPSTRSLVPRIGHVGRIAVPSAHVSIRQHTSAYVSIRQHTSAYVSIRQHTSAYLELGATDGPRGEDIVGRRECSVCQKRASTWPCRLAPVPK